MPGSWKASLHFTPTRGHSQPKYLLQMRTNFTSPDPHNPGPFFVYSDEVFIIAASYTPCPPNSTSSASGPGATSAAPSGAGPPGSQPSVKNTGGRLTIPVLISLLISARTAGWGWMDGGRGYVNTICQQMRTAAHLSMSIGHAIKRRDSAPSKCFVRKGTTCIPCSCYIPYPTRIGSIEWIRLELKWHWTCEWIPFACPVPLQLEHDASRGEFSLDVEECSKQMASIYSSNLRDQKCCSGDAVEHRSGPQMSGQTYRQRKIRVIFDLSTAASAHAGSGRPIEEHWEEEEGCQSLARAS
ncbi:hypothetical protein B0H10DRAFT_1964649 [Mycena sp. CBHHK59/15]|nr:hypothetical protein B0H10DRAFT_1964649 [Mycena sp. CBHHK59/15]